MPQQCLHFVDAGSTIDQNTGIGVAQIMDAYIRQVDPLSCPVPCEKEEGIGFLELGIEKDVVFLCSWKIEPFSLSANFFEQLNCATVEHDLSAATVLADWNDPRFLVQIKVAPACQSSFAAAGTCEDQQLCKVIKERMLVALTCI